MRPNRTTAARLLIPLLFTASPVFAQQAPVPIAPCAPYDHGLTGPYSTGDDTQQHVDPGTSSEHGAWLQDSAYCTYGAAYTGQNCPVNMTASGQNLSFMSEVGQITVLKHLATLGFYVANEVGGESPQSVTSATVGAVKSFGTENCTNSITVGFPPVTETYNPPGEPLWVFHEQTAFTCAQETGAVCNPPVGGCGPKYIWDYTNCVCQFVGGSPILIDTKNVGFHLSSPEKGKCVPFDLRGDGKEQCWSWPEEGSGNGWLVWPGRTRHDGTVDSGLDMFGDMTDQIRATYDKPPCSINKTCDEANGYVALQMLKQKSMGGHQDYKNQDAYLILTKADKHFSDLRIWIDDNPRNGKVDPGELHTLDEFNIHSFSLNPAMTGKHDDNGNWFRFCAPLNVGVNDVRKWAKDNDARAAGNQGKQVDSRTCDVFLKSSD